MPRYSAKQQKLRGRTSGKRQFLMLYRNVKRSAAYHGLSLGARAALIELIDRYSGCNNGMIRLGVRELAFELRCSVRGACGFLRELDDAKLAHPVTVGVWRGRKASEWRLTFSRCDKTGELPTTQWEQMPAYEPESATKLRTRKPLSNAERQRHFRERRSNENRNAECTQGSAEVHPGKRVTLLSAPGEAQTPKNSINRNGPSAPGEAHIHIYQGDAESEGERLKREARGRQVAQWLPKKGGHDPYL